MHEFRQKLKSSLNFILTLFYTDLLCIQRRLDDVLLACKLQLMIIIIAIIYAIRY